MGTTESKKTLPRDVVERIFKKLSLLYGREFLAMYEGLDIEEVKQDWAEELGRFAEWPQALQFALEKAPAKWPPKVREFAEIADCAPRPKPPALPPPPRKPLSPQAKEAIAKLRVLARQMQADGERVRVKAPADRPHVFRLAREQEAA